MKRKTTMRVALAGLAALTLAGAMPLTARADGYNDKDKGKKSTPVIIGTITKSDDPPPKKK